MADGWTSLPLPSIPPDLLRRYFEEEVRLAKAAEEAEAADAERRPSFATLERAGERLGALFREIRELALADAAVTAAWRRTAHAESLERVRARDARLAQAMEREGALDVKALDDVVVKRMLGRLRDAGAGGGRWPGEA
ncbi:MAG: hypothetical protein IT452_19960 [Planctomycetia bacterium]|nr:hypothetical protein [Planctomycetia bacterium]